MRKGNKDPKIKSRSKAKSGTFEFMKEYLIVDHMKWINETRYKDKILISQRCFCSSSE